jgi:hypothetical protein
MPDHGLQFVDCQRTNLDKGQKRRTRDEGKQQDDRREERKTDRYPREVVFEERSNFRSLGKKRRERKE